MKLKILLVLLIFSVLFLDGQEIKLSSSVLASAGSNADINTINVSKWRIGEVHYIVLQQNDPPIVAKDWTISLFPNPFTKMIYLEYKSEKTGEYKIQVTDITGKTILYNQQRIFKPKETIELDLGFLVPSFYLFSICSKDNTLLQVIKVLKR